MVLGCLGQRKQAHDLSHASSADPISASNLRSTVHHAGVDQPLEVVGHKERMWLRLRVLGVDSALQCLHAALRTNGELPREVLTVVRLWGGGVPDGNRRGGRLRQELCHSPSGLHRGSVPGKGLACRATAETDCAVRGQLQVLSLHTERAAHGVTSGLQWARGTLGEAMGELCRGPLECCYLRRWRLREALPTGR